MIAKISYKNRLTAGKSYKVVSKSEHCIVVINNLGKQDLFSHAHFEEEKLHTKTELIEAYREGFQNDLPFIDMEKWYNEKFGKNDSGGQ